MTEKFTIITGATANGAVVAYSRNGWLKEDTFRAIALKKGLLGNVNVRFGRYDFSGKGRTTTDREIKFSL